MASVQYSYLYREYSVLVFEIVNYIPCNIMGVVYRGWWEGGAGWVRGKGGVGSVGGWVGKSKADSPCH